MKLKTAIDYFINVMWVISLILLCIIGYIVYEENGHKDAFDKMCKEAGGIPLTYTYHYDRIQNRIEYTCLSVNAVIDVE